MAAIKYLIIIAGPTAIGKTSLSIEIAKTYDAEVISSDSRQYYRDDAYSIGQFERDVIDKLEQRFLQKDVMIMTGGSGMHIRAITHGLDDFPMVDQTIRDRWELIFEKKGIEPLRQALIERDPTYAENVDMDNSRRLIRALSVMDVDGKPFSSYLNQPAKARSFVPIYIMLERDRNDLYSRINRRVDQMLKDGLEAEATRLYQYKDLQALNTIGYKEWFDHFDGQTTRGEAVALIKRNSRRYAKRQMTWFRKEEYWMRFEVDQLNSIVDHINFKMTQ